MINGIIRAMSVAIDNEFNNGQDRYEIYDKEIPQDIHEPAFYIQSINPDTNLFLGQRYLSHNHLVVQYFPESATDYQEECNTVGERLWWCLEWIWCEGDDLPTHGFNMRFEVNDGVLSFFVDYEDYLHKSEAMTPMEKLALQQFVEKGSN